jgi:hypothetical protein
VSTPQTFPLLLSLIRDYTTNDGPRVWVLMEDGSWNVMPAGTVFTAWPRGLVA